MVILTYFVLIIKEHILKKARVGLHLRMKLIERYEPLGKIWYFDSNVLNSYEKMRQHIHGSFVRIAYGKVFLMKQITLMIILNLINGNI